MKNYLSMKRGLLSAFLVLISLTTTLAVEVTVNFNNSLSQPIEGASVSYYSGSWINLGSTDANGQVIAEVPEVAANMKFRIFYNDTYEDQVKENFVSDPFVYFNTVNATVSLLDENNVEYSADNIQFWGSSGWNTFGSGTTTSSMEMLSKSYTFRIYYQNTYKNKAQNIGTDPLVIFNLVNVTMKLVNSESIEIESDNAQYYSNGWNSFGDGVTTESITLLEGSYKFRIFYEGSNEVKIQDISIDPIVLFNTVKVEIQYAGYMEVGSGSYIPFLGSMELLPKIYTFRFFNAISSPSQALYKSINATSSIAKSAAYLTFSESDGDKISNAAVQSYNGAWEAQDATNINGKSLVLVDGLVSELKTRVYHGGAYADASQDISTDSYLYFSTVLVSMDLFDSESNSLESSGAEYYANGWQQFGDGVTSESIELLPQSYNFRVSYAGGQNSKIQDVNADANVVFSTIPVSVNLMDSHGDDLLSSNVLYQGSNGLMQFGNGLTPVSKELLPMNYTFRMSYAGAIMDQDADVAMNADVAFATVPVTMNIYDENMNILVGSDASYDFSGPTQFGDGSTPGVMELLPVEYNFSAMYNGDGYSTSQNTAFNPNVSFMVALAPEASIEMEDENEMEGIDFNINPISIEDESIDNNIASDNSFSVYPNPFSDVSTLKYKVEKESAVSIKIYDVNGTLINTLLESTMHKGEYQLEWNGTDQMGNAVPSGMYLYSISIENNTDSQMIILQK